MFTSEIIDYKDVLTDDLRKPGKWIIANLEPSMSWPVRVQKIVYIDQEYWLIPITNDAYPGIAVKAQGGSEAELREKILRFVSVLSWIANGGASLISFGGGSQLFAYSRPRGGGQTICNQIDLRYLPEISDPKAKLALALMREARGLRHAAYSFLTFWRVLEVAVGRSQIRQWAPGALAKVNDPRANEALATIVASGVEDVAGHLYVSGRCAIAHAGSNPIIDPDDPDDAWRLAIEKPLVEALAVLAIEENLGVKTSSTIRREHLYELGGFKRLLGMEIVGIILNNSHEREGVRIELPVVDIGLFNKMPLAAFTSLHPVSFACSDGSALIAFERQDGLLRVQFTLKFQDERLEFDIHNGLFGPPDDGSPEWAEVKGDTHEFAKWYYLNGCFTVTDIETGELIARKDEFIPMNVIVEPEGFDSEIRHWRDIAAQRRRISQGDHLK